MQPPETAVNLQKRVGREFALLVGLVTIVLVFGLFAAYWASSHLGPEVERLHSFGEAGLVLVLAGVAIWFGRRLWRDIQRLQEDAELSLADMERARAQLQSFTRAAPAAIYHRVPTRGFPISWVSENSEPYFGYPASYLIEQPKFFTSRIHPDDRPNVQFSVGPPFADQWLTQEYRFQRADGVYIWVSDTMRLATEPMSGAQQIVGSWMDVTAQRKSNAREIANKPIWTPSCRMRPSGST